MGPKFSRCAYPQCQHRQPAQPGRQRQQETGLVGNASRHLPVVAWLRIKTGGANGFVATCPFRGNLRCKQDLLLIAREIPGAHMHKWLFSGAIFLLTASLTFCEAANAAEHLPADAPAKAGTVS